MKTIDIEECAEFLKIDRNVALKLAGEGKIPGAKIGRAWVFLVEDLVEFLKAEVRTQARERQERAGILKDMESARVITPPAVIELQRGRQKKVRANLDAYDLPELLRQV